MTSWSYKMKVRKSDLKLIVEEVMKEAPALAKADPKKMAKGGITGPRKNQNQINKLYAGANGFTGLIDKLDNNVAALVKAKAISSASAKVIKGQIGKVLKTAGIGYKAEEDKHKRGK